MTRTNKKDLNQPGNEVESLFTSKWSLKMLKEEYEKNGIDFDETFGKIKDVCIKTLMSVEPYIIS
jgi:hypothetical protein